VTSISRKQGASAGDRVYGLLYSSSTDGDHLKTNIAVEAVRLGHATPKGFTSDVDDSKIDEGDTIVEYETLLQSAFQEAKSNAVGVHSPTAFVRNLKNASDDFETLELVEKSKRLCDGNAVTCVIEHIFDGSRFRVLVTDPDMAKAGLQYASFTLILAGVASPRVGNSLTEPPVPSDPYAEEAKQFVELRLLQRELKISLHGVDKSGVCAVGTVHHPKGNISIELLKNGLARMSDWSSRMMNPLDLPALRVAENNAKV